MIESHFQSLIMIFKKQFLNHLNGLIFVLKHIVHINTSFCVENML